jgi:hypothetical protein
MDTPPPQKKGLGPLAWLGIGCGALIVIVIIVVVIAGMFMAPKMKKFGEDFQKNPTKATATTMVSVSMGALELVAEDDANKRYTVKEKNSGKLTTIYWDEKKQAPATIPGDFSAIPADASTPALPATPAPK